MKQFNQVIKNASKHRLAGILILICCSLLLLILTGVQNDIQSWSLTLCEAFANNPNLEMAQCPVHTTNVSSLLNLAFVPTIFLICIGLYLIFMKSNKAETSKLVHEKIEHKKKSEIPYLNSEEKKIYELVNDSGSIYQSDLMKKTDFSKVKITRILDKLENKDLIERKRRGMTNIVVLK